MVQKQGPNRLVALLVLGFLVVGLLALGGGIFGSLEAFASRSWPSTPGQVTASRLVVVTPTPSGDSTTDSEAVTMYSVQVQYAYQAGGESFTGSRVTLSDFASSEQADVEHLLARYPAGKTVQIYYDPQNPGSSVLEPGFTAGMWVPLAVGGLLTVFGLGLVTWYLRGLRRGSLNG